MKQGAHKNGVSWEKKLAEALVQPPVHFWVLRASQLVSNSPSADQQALKRRCHGEVVTQVTVQHQQHSAPQIYGFRNCSGGQKCHPWEGEAYSASGEHSSYSRSAHPKAHSLLRGWLLLAHRSTRSGGR